MLDRQVGNAAPSIDPVWAKEGVSRTGGQASRARPAMLAMVGRGPAGEQAWPANPVAFVIDVSGFLIS